MGHLGPDSGMETPMLRGGGTERLEGRESRAAPCRKYGSDEGGGPGIKLHQGLGA